jgi:hypothetical protein
MEGNSLGISARAFVNIHVHAGLLRMAGINDVTITGRNEATKTV